MNLYGFCDGNPVNEIDPNGTNGWDTAKQAALGIGDGVYNLTIGAGIIGQIHHTIHRYQLARKYGVWHGGLIGNREDFQGFVHGYTDIASGNPRKTASSAVNIAATVLTARVGAGIFKGAGATAVAESSTLESSVSLFHKGNLSGGTVGVRMKAFSTGFSEEDVNAVIKGTAPVHKFVVPQSVLDQWFLKGWYRDSTTQMGGVTIRERAFSPQAQRSLENYRVK